MYPFRHKTFRCLDVYVCGDLKVTFRSISIFEMAKVVVSIIEQFSVGHLVNLTSLKIKKTKNVPIEAKGI
jgi:hypothetical protein